jgi:hypothetical protein
MAPYVEAALRWDGVREPSLAQQVSDMPPFFDRMIQPLADEKEHGMPFEQHDLGLTRILASGQEVEELLSGFGNDHGPW